MSNDAKLERNEKIQSMDELLSMSIDDLDDLPSYDVPPVGTYLCKHSLERKEVNNKEAIQSDFTIVEVLELKNPESDTAPAAGSQFNQLFTLNPYGIGALKKWCVPFAKQFGEPSINALVNERVKDVLVTVQVTHKKDKEDPDIVRPRVKLLAIA